MKSEKVHFQGFLLTGVCFILCKILIYWFAAVYIHFHPLVFDTEELKCCWITFCGTLASVVVTVNLLRLKELRLM